MNPKKPNPTDRYIGGRVRQRRLELQMSQTALGDKLGLTFQQVQKYEKGQNRIGGSRMVQIADALNVPVAWLFSGVPTTFEGGPVTDLSAVFLATRQGIELARAFIAIPSDVIRASIVSHVQKLAEHGDGRS